MTCHYCIVQLHLHQPMGEIVNLAAVAYNDTIAASRLGDLDRASRFTGYTVDVVERLALDMLERLTTPDEIAEYLRWQTERSSGRGVNYLTEPRASLCDSPNRLLDDTVVSHFLTPRAGA